MEKDTGKNTEMRSSARSQAPIRECRGQGRWLVPAALAGLLLASLLTAGCATRNYPGPVHGLAFDGRIESIDIQNHRLVLFPLTPSEPVVFAYEASTRFWRNGLPIHPNEVEPGQSVRLHYHMVAAQQVAHHVYVQVPYAPH